VGYPAYEQEPTYRREAEEFVHYDKYDMSKFRTGEQVIKFIRKLRELTESAYAPEKTPSYGHPHNRI
jgi:hypothetical protein